MRLLVVGSEGFAGRALIRRAQDHGISVAGASHLPRTGEYDHLPIDRCALPDVELLTTARPTAVVLAASTGSVGKAQSQPATAFRDTIQTLNSLLLA